MPPCPRTHERRNGGCSAREELLLAELEHASSAARPAERAAHAAGRSGSHTPVGTAASSCSNSSCVRMGRRDAVGAGCEASPDSAPWASLVRVFEVYGETEPVHPLVWIAVEEEMPWHVEGRLEASEHGAQGDAELVLMGRSLDARTTRRSRGVRKPHAASWGGWRVMTPSHAPWSSGKQSAAA